MKYLSTNITDFSNIRLSDVIHFYEDFDVSRVIFQRYDASHGYLRFELYDETPDGDPFAATEIAAVEDCVMAAKEIRDTNNIHLNNGISDIHVISFENFGNLLD